MARMSAKAKTSRITRAIQSAAPDVSVYCGDLEKWPRSWMGLEKDLLPGEGMIACFRRFIEYLAGTGLSSKTIRRHVDNLWSLGGEIIRDLHYDPSLRKRTAERLLRDSVHESGGPSVHNASEEQQRSFDSTCRRLHRYLARERP